MTYRTLGLLRQRYYTWEVHGEIRYISSSRKQIEEMVNSWSLVPNSKIEEYYLEFA